MGLVKWFKNTFFGGDSDSKKKKKRNSDGSVNVSSVESKRPSSKTYQAYQKSEQSKKEKSQSAQKQAENAWGNAFSKGTLWGSSEKKSNIKSLDSDKDSKSKSNSTENKAKYKSLVSDAEKNNLESNVAKEKLDEKEKSNKKSDSKNGKSSKERTSELKESLSNADTPISLRGTGKGTLQKKLEEKIKDVKEKQAKYEKAMGDDKKSKHEVQLEQKIGNPERTKKDVEWASKENPKALYTARKFTSGLTLGGEKLLEKVADDDVKKSLKKNDKSAEKEWIKPVESKDLSDTDKRLLSESPKALSGKGGKEKGLSGKAVGEIAELAGNMATFGATSGITKGIGEKGLNKLAKATKLGDTAEQALEKTKLVQKLSGGKEDVAKKVAKRLADGLAEGTAVDATAGAVQSAVDASIKKSEDKDASWGKEFAKNQAINFALGGATEVGLSALKSKKLQKEAIKNVDNFVSSRTAKEKATNLNDTAKKDLSELFDNVLPGEKTGEKKSSNLYKAVQLDADTQKSLATTPEKKITKRQLRGENIPMSAYDDGTADSFKEYIDTNNAEKLDTQKKLKSINGKISRTQKRFDKLDMEWGQKQGAGIPWTDAEEAEFQRLDRELASQKALKERLVKQKETNASKPKSYDDWKALNESKATADVNNADMAQTAENTAENVVKASDNTTATKANVLSAEDRASVENELASLDAQKKQIESEQIGKLKKGENSVSDMASREAKLQEIEARQTELKRTIEQDNILKQSADNAQSDVQSAVNTAGDSGFAKEYENTKNYNKKVAMKKSDDIRLQQRGSFESRPDTVLNRAEQTVTPRNIADSEAVQESVKPLVESADVSKLNKDSHLDRAILDLKEDYDRAVRRGDTAEAMRLSGEFTKTYNAKQVVESYGEGLLRNQNVEGTRKEIGFHIMDAEEMRGLGNNSKIIPTTEKQSKKFARKVDLANVEHRLEQDGLKTGKTTKTMYNSAKSDEARKILTSLTESGYLDTAKHSIKKDTNQVINDVIADPTAVAQELQNYIDGTKGFYLDDAYRAMLKAEALYAYCSKHVAEDEGFQKGMALASNYIAKYGSTTGNTMRAMSMFASCSPRRQRMLLQSNLEELCKDRGVSVESLLGTAEKPSELMKKINAFESATDEVERDALRKGIFNDAYKMTNSDNIMDIINTWRYLAMLSKPTTHARNAIGNAISTAMRFFSDIQASWIQDSMYRKGLIDEKTIGKLSFDDMMAIFGNSEMTGAKFESLNKYLDMDVDLLIGNTEKYGSTRNEWYKNNSAVARTIKKVSDFNSNMMNVVDKHSVATNYKKRYLQYLNANNFTENAELLEKATKQSDELVGNINKYKSQIKELEAGGNVSEAKTLKAEMAKLQNKVSRIDADIRTYQLKQRNIEDKARVHARQEALEATFREQNELADWFKNAQRKGRAKDATAFDKAKGFVADATNPFAGTSSNILRQSVRFSPAGLAVNTIKLNKAIKSGDVHAINSAVERVAGGLTGSAVFALGVYLGQNQIGETSWNPLSWALQGSMSDSDTNYYQKSLGVQDYSIVVGEGKNKYSLTLDWLTPTASALFMGGAFGKVAQTIGDNTAYEGNFYDSLSNSTKILSEVVQPVLETSMLDTFSNILESSTSDSESNSAVNITKAMAQSYIASFAPNLLRGVAKTLRPYEYSHAVESETDGGKQTERWLNNLKNGFRIDDGGDAKTDVWGNISGKRGNIAVSAFNGLVNPANVKKVTIDKTDEENIKLYNKLSKADNKSAKYALPQTYYKTKANINGTNIKLDSVDVSKLNQARASKEGAKEAISDLLDTKAFNKKSVRLSDSEKEKILNKNFKNTKEVVAWLHTTDAWKKASSSEKLTMQMTVLGQTTDGKKKGSAKAGFVDVYEHQGKSAVDFYYDNDITASKKAKLKDLAKTKEGKQKILDFADGAISKSFNDEGLLYKNYPLKTMFPYLNQQVSEGKLTEKEASQLFEAYKASQTKRSYYYGATAGSSSGYRRRYSGYRRYRRSGGGSSSSKSGKVVQIKTSAFNPTTTSSDYKSLSSSSSSTSSKKKHTIKSNVSTTAPTVKSAETFVKTKKKKS